MALLTRWLVKSRDPATRARAAAALGASKRSSALHTLLPMLADPSTEVQRAVVEALGTLGDPRAVPALADQLTARAGARDDASVAIRIAAARALGGLGSAAVQALAAALQDRSPKVREVAIAALGSLHTSEAVPALVLALRDDRSHLRQEAARALAAIGGKDAHAALTAALQHKDPATRAAAVEALAALGNTHSVPALSAALRDQDKAVRERAVAALGRIASPEAIEALVTAYEGPERDVRQAVAAVLRQVAWEPNSPDQRAVHAVVHGQFEAALAEGPAAVGPLLKGLEDKDGATRRLVADALGRTGDPRAAGPLVGALADPDEEVRQASIQALIRIGEPAAASVVAALESRSRQVRAAASDVLAAIGEDRAVALLFAPLATRTISGARVPRHVVTRHGEEVAELGPDEDVVQLRVCADTLRILLAHAAARLPASDLERIASLRDLVEIVHRDARGPRELPSAPEEVSCAELRELAHRELARRRGAAGPA